MAERPRSTQESFELSEDEISPEHLDSQVQKAQEQLIALKRQQEHIERQKRDLEEMSRRQDQLQSGRAEMVEKFTRALVVIEREEFETQRRAEMLHNIRESFTQHLQYFETLDLKGVEGPELTRELTRALSALDDARTDYLRSIPRIGAPDADSVEAASEFGYGHDRGSHQDFVSWMKMGLGFTLPIVIVGLLIFFALLSGGHR
ncbi:MAG: hypothetical protein RLZZ399_1589 [Verrucomicrobiota bacterium]|jgi:hypothetical protein